MHTSCARRGMAWTHLSLWFECMKKGKRVNTFALMLDSKIKEKPHVFDRSQKWTGFISLACAVSVLPGLCAWNDPCSSHCTCLPSTSYNIWEGLKCEEGGETGHDLEGRNATKLPEILELQGPPKWCWNITWGFNICWSGEEDTEASVSRS